MYSSLRNVQILVALLKKYEISNIVISAGTRHTPFVYSVEHDDFFKTYSIVDERSASFFAIGLIEELHKPVAIVCTSGTAAANYVSAANEAFYQQLPLLILTADRNHYYMFQQEEQMIPQEELYSQVCKKVVTLGHVRDDKDFWFCSRICNEALLELTQGELGPVHINFIIENDYPIKQGIIKFDDKVLPEIHRVERLTLEDDIETWKQWAKKLIESRVLIIYGQYRPVSNDEQFIIDSFVDRYNCVIATDVLSNMRCKKSIKTYVPAKVFGQDQMDDLCPDIVITMNANTISGIKNRLTSLKNKFIHWHVSSRGEVSDPFKCLSDVVACSPLIFFRKFAELANLVESRNISVDEYYYNWKVACMQLGEKGSFNREKINYSSMYAVQQYMNHLPKNSLLHIANSNSIRLAAYFDVDPTITVYDNRGTHGIDGSMSAFIGQAHVSGRPSFLIIGDLSFFYDMNALWNQYVGNNVRILVCNNAGGAIFHTYPNKTNVPTLDEHIAAAHETSVKEWVISRGFKYLSAHNRDELDEHITKLTCAESEQPILLEVFTDMEVDVQCIKDIIKPYQPKAISLKGQISQKMPKSMKSAIKKIIQ